MNLDRVTQYVNTLYEKSRFNKEKYIESTGLEKFGTVVDEDVSRMLHIFVRLTCAKKILEIGTSIGYSTISMAEATKEYNGKIITIEYDQQVAKQAIKNFERYGVAENVEVKIGDALEIVPRIREKFDLIFQDVGDKGLYPILFDHCVRLLKHGGLLLAEDALHPIIEMNSDDQFAPHNDAAIFKFNEMVANCPSLESTILPIGDGLTVAVKIG
jgi:predicted O-methyltransferase YrrM